VGDIIYPLVGNFMATVLDNLRSLDPGSGMLSMLTYTMTFILSLEFIHRHRVALGGTQNSREQKGVLMASVAQLIHEGSQPSVENVVLTYNLLTQSGGIRG
jgi:hypothetical protein